MKSPEQILKRFYRRQLSSYGITGQTLVLGSEGMLCTFEAARLNFTICARRFFMAAKNNLTVFVKEVS